MHLLSRELLRQWQRLGAIATDDVESIALAAAATGDGNWPVTFIGGSKMF